MNMKNEDPFENIGSEVVGATRGKEVGEVLPPSSPSSSKVIKRVFHTRSEFLIYPNGMIYPGKTQSWFEQKLYEHKPKEKKLAKIKQSQLTAEESY